MKKIKKVPSEMLDSRGFQRFSSVLYEEQNKKEGKKTTQLFSSSLSLCFFQNLGYGE